MVAKTSEDLKHTSLPQTQGSPQESLDPPNSVNIKRLAWASAEDNKIQKKRKTMEVVTSINQDKQGLKDLKKKKKKL